jgi:hypothetical protein
MTELNTLGNFSNTSESQSSSDGAQSQTAGYKAPPAPSPSDIAKALTDNLEDLPDKLGQTNIHKTSSEIRVGPGEHISIVRRDGGGKRRGWWIDFKADVSGTDGLDYAAHVLGTNIAGAMRWATSSFTIIPTVSFDRKKTEISDEEDQRSDLIKKIRSASRVWEQTRPLAGTVGDVFFRETRGITCRIGNQIRFHPHLFHKSKSGVVTYWPAIVCAVTISPNRHLTGVWRIYLSPDGEKAPVDNSKKGLGATFGHGGAVRLTDAASSHLHIAEGIENGLAAISMKPELSVWCGMAVSGFGSMAIPSHVNRVTLLADNDPTGSPAYKSMMKGAEALARRGLQVGIVRPPVGHKDLNDLLLGMVS